MEVTDRIIDYLKETYQPDSIIAYTTEEKEKAKLQNAKERYDDLSFVPMKQCSHTDLFRRMELIPFYFRLIEDCRRISS